MSIAEKKAQEQASPEELVPQVKEVIRRSRNILRGQPVELMIDPVASRLLWIKERYWMAKDHEVAYRIVMLGVEPEGCFSVNSREVLSGPLDHGLFIWGIKWQTSNSFVLYDIPRNPTSVTPSKVWHLSITNSELVQKIENDLKWGHAIKKHVFRDALNVRSGGDKEKFASKILG